jgi:hypothetical protein
MTDTVILKPIVGTSMQQPTDTKWQNIDLAVMWRKFTGRDAQDIPIDQSPDRGSGWMK